MTDAEMTDAAIQWLLDEHTDVAVRYQAHRDLLGHDDMDLRRRIASEGDGAALLAARGANGHWGRGFYQPKWTSSHYTLLELKNLGLPPDTPAPRETGARILAEERGRDGGLNPSRTIGQSDVCVNGMAMNYLSYFGALTDDRAGVVDFILAQRMADGGFNCRSNRSGATHSSVHTTVSVIEGITEYLRHGLRYRADELAAASASSVEFLLRHRLFRSEHTGEPMHPEFTRLHHPASWHFDILRGLDALRDAGIAYDTRMDDAIEILRRRQRDDGRWAASSAYPGATHLPPVRAGRPHPWVTLIALRVLAAYGA
ncbi:hypothetical protein [Agromyces bauzanensis]|uniref:Squalene cyclase C-terminal domain-containing protein n=1 Tax=Agromyces bauzanensis TaxID=1308924 RepID=A0A917PQQ7_9MICO|nr:hypothetical protein [Agromyces bauzanensis]GGJ87742.1 hypothetical protein GCM10011372_27830 [Agromyces bauzanensis]